MKSCCVVDCGVNSDSDDVTFFEFPTSRSLRRKWLDVIQLNGKLTVDSTVCSGHFSKTDYEVVRGKVRLKRKVVPAIFNANEGKNDNGDIETESENPQNVSSKNTKITNETKDTSASKQSVDETPLSKLKSVSERHEIVNDEPTTTSSTLDNENVNINANSVRLEKLRRNLKKIEGRLSNKNARPSPKICVEAGVAEDHVRSDITLDPDPRQDIEEMITNYQIKNNPKKLSNNIQPLDEEPEVVDVSETRVVESEPVFIEVAVGQDGVCTEGAGSGNGDCLMVLESVQVELDPSTLMLPDRDDEDMEDDDDDDDIMEVNKKDDPISLLTSSDEDEVIIQEPKIDTVEVSDEDEDDIPLVRLTKKKKTENPSKCPNITQIMWGVYDYYCYQCKYNTTSGSDYAKHLKIHETVLQMCQICGYTTSSKSQFNRHNRKHKEEKRFSCHLCGFKSKHQMSMIYHLKSHEGQMKKFACSFCGYESNRKRDLRSHVQKKHGDDKEFKT